MYGILCATPEELEALRAQLHLQAEPQTYGATQVWLGRHGDRPVALALAGMGKVNAAAAATVLLAVHGADALIFAGVAGGLNPSLGVGSVLLGERLAIHDYGVVTERRLIPTRSGHMPISAPRLTEGHRVTEPVAAMLAALREIVAGRLDAPVALGSIITGDYFLSCVETRADLHAAFGADAIDMESGAVGQVAEAWNTPLYVIRTLSDLAGEDSHLTYGEMARMAAHNSALCVTALLALLADSG